MTRNSEYRRAAHAFLAGVLARNRAQPEASNPYRLPDPPLCLAGWRSRSAEARARQHEAWVNGWHYEDRRLRNRTGS